MNAPDRRRLFGRHRVVVVGAGFGGLAVAKGLRDLPVEVVLVDANNFHTFQPLLYQLATAGLDDDNVAYAVRGIFRRQRNVSFRMSRVTGIDLDRRCLALDRGGDLDYDTLVLATGAVSHDFDVPGVAEHAFPLKSLDHALDLRTHVLDRFEQVEVRPELLDDGALDVVVCGGGPTGVETSGGLMELYERVLEPDFRDVPVRRARIVLVEAGPRLLPGFTEPSSARAAQTLARLGVEVRCGVGVARVEPTRVHLSDGSVLAAHTLVWAAGVTASPLAVALGVQLERGGRVVVADDLSIPGHPEVFAIGDIAAARAPDGTLLPQVAQPAIQGGKHVARQIARRVSAARGGPGAGLEPVPEPFRYVDRGSMATIGRNDAVAEFPNGRRLWGVVGWLAWLGLHLVYLMGFRNRANVFVNWSWNYLTYDHGSRILAEWDRRRVGDQRPRRRRYQLSE
ncbi:NAD(P)/FAD-dependent oxidoreductase [soil metagenome]